MNGLLWFSKDDHWRGNVEIFASRKRIIPCKYFFTFNITRALLPKEFECAKTFVEIRAANEARRFKYIYN